MHLLPKFTFPLPSKLCSNVVFTYHPILINALMIKALNKIGLEGAYLNIVKAIYEKTYS